MSFEALEAYQHHQMTDEVNQYCNSCVASKRLFLCEVLMANYLKTPVPLPLVSLSILRFFVNWANPWKREYVSLN